MQKLGGSIVVLNFRDTYHEIGEYDFKIILDKKKFKNGHDATIKMADAEKKDVSLDVKRWGRKINCHFSLSEKDPNGVYVVSFNARDDKGNDVEKSFHCWVIK